MRGRIRSASISARLFALQLVFILSVTAAATVWLWADARTGIENTAAAKCLTVATSIADNPFVVTAVQGQQPTALLQPYAEAIMADTSTDFITIMAPDRTRFTHPDPAQIGKPFQGTIEPALEGRSFTETYAGTLGPSVRAVVPIRDASGSIVALVSAGVTVNNVSTTLASRLAILFSAAGLTVLVGALGSWLLSRYLRRVTWGRGPEELSRMFEYYESVLRSVREGLLLVDHRGRLTLYNDQAADLLGLTRDGPQPPVPVGELELPPSLIRLLASGTRAVDEVFVTDDRVLVVNQEVARRSTERDRHQPPERDGRGRATHTGKALGTVVTLRDHTELIALAGEIETMRTLTDALRSQTHEFANRLHTIVGLIELGRAEEAVSFASNELTLTQELANQLVDSGAEPVLAALVFGKVAQARERGIDLVIELDESVGHLELEPVDVVTIVGNLIDNAFDAATRRSRTAAASAAGANAVSTGGATAGATAVSTAPRVVVSVSRDDTGLLISVSDNGPGVDDSATIFRRGFTTKEASGGVGLALVAQTVKRLGGEIEVSSAEGATFEVRLPW